jgi:primosomal protein N' (replication factor Y)
MLVHDFEGFARAELKWRKAMAYPPFTRLVALRIEGLDPEETKSRATELAKRLARKLPPPSWGVRLLGPAPAPIRKLKGKTRWQMLLKGPSHASLAGPLLVVEAFLDELPASVKVAIDVDPAAML